MFLSKRPVLHNLRVLRNLYFSDQLSSAPAEQEELGSKSRFAFDLDSKVQDDLKCKRYKAKRHPGILPCRHVTLPKDLLETANVILKEYPKSKLLQDGKKLSDHIRSRHPPLEEGQLKVKIKEFKEKILRKELKVNFGNKSEDEIQQWREEELKKMLVKKIYNWKPLEFNDYLSVVYMAIRFAPDYAALVQIMSEIQKKKPAFQPKTLFDFGSGVGSVMWAVDRVWPNVCKEAFCVDVSANINNIADRLLRRGDNSNERVVRPHSTFFRQFLPASESIKYDLVVSSRSLFEVGNILVRARTVDILWRKVTQGGMLVLVEAGTNSGYTLLLEARDYLLEITNKEAEHQGDCEIHIVSPCSHDKFCPRFLDGTNTPCNFTVGYETLMECSPQKDVYSYIVIQKSSRSDKSWPRIVRPVLKKHKHIIMRCCTSSGALKEFVATKRKHSSDCYSVCKQCEWGDLLPVNDVSGT